MSFVSSGVEDVSGDITSELQRESIISTSFGFGKSRSIFERLYAEHLQNDWYSGDDAQAAADLRDFIESAYGRSDEQVLQMLGSYSTRASTAETRIARLDAWAGSNDDIDWLATEYAIPQPSGYSNSFLHSTAQTFGLELTDPMLGNVAYLYDQGFVNCPAGQTCDAAAQLSAFEGTNITKRDLYAQIADERGLTD